MIVSLRLSELKYLEVFRQKQLAGPQEAEDVTEDISISVDEVVLLQTVQHDGLGAVKQTTDPADKQRNTGLKSAEYKLWILYSLNAGSFAVFVVQLNFYSRNIVLVLVLATRQSSCFLDFPETVQELSEWDLK